MLTKLSREALIDRSSWDVIEMNVCSTRRCCAFGTWIGRIVKTYDYINRIVITLMRVRGRHSPLSLLCITMILRVRRKFFEITTFPPPSRESELD